MIRPLCVLGLALALVASAPHAPHAAARVGAWNLKTDELDANLATGAFSAPDHVTMTRADGSVVQADRATGNYKLQQASLYGNVSVHDAGGTFGLRSAQQAQPPGPATLTADEVHVDDKTRLYDATGNVHYEQGDTTAEAQNAHLNDKTHQLDLSGNVHIVQADHTLDAQHATYNTLSGAGQADTSVTILFPGITPSIATPKPIRIRGMIP